jgi:enamine deaminase RidA (YjgF/YER057c/UK114 family)
LRRDRKTGLKEGKQDMTIRRIDVGARMSDIVIHNNTIYLAGQVGAPGASVAEQTKQILATIDGLLAKAGSNKSKLLQTIIWLDDMANFAEMNSVWDAWIDKANPPARATGEAKLASPDYKVEIIVVAAAD